ncbi:uncharacterized protein LOC106082657 [Stomoxys calcitrans]|uniref:uncharacterized protein LOC106082657 n=1 Tax=Stomoxys calcitrans TaxID=35570 RepID=UPI0027E30DD2|nr:uncharacterized protein LOC106082657 [Stomoxys calcitrans]
MSSAADSEGEWFKTEIIPKLLKNGQLLSDNNESTGVTDNFVIKNLTVQFIGSQEAFMLTKCYRVRLNYECEGVDGEINFFVKRTPPIPQFIFDAINFNALFSNEQLTYEQIIPSFENFGKCHLNTAKFYYADLKPNEAILVTEDFTSNGWRVTKDKYNLSLEHTLVAVKYLAQFHAIGFAMLATDKEQFDKITKGLMEPRYSTDDLDHRWALTLSCGLERSIIATKKYHKDFPQEFLEKYKNLFKNPQKYCRDVVQPKEPFVTLCHGDYLRNNVAYKYDTEERPIDIMMFDLQTPRLSSPMLDFCTFLALSTFYEVRHQHFREIFDCYCNQLKEAYESMSQTKAPEFMSFDSMLKEYIRFLPYSIFTCSSFLMELVEPHGLSTEEMLNLNPTDEDITHKILTKGGEIVDREFAHQMNAMYELSTIHKVDLF